MTQATTSKALTDPLRGRINRYAHAQGIQHENTLRAALTTQVQQARDAGATYDELAAMVNRMESAK